MPYILDQDADEEAYDEARAREDIIMLMLQDSRYVQLEARPFAGLTAMQPAAPLKAESGDDVVSDGNDSCDTKSKGKEVSVIQQSMTPITVNLSFPELRTRDSRLR